MKVKLKVEIEFSFEKRSAVGTEILVFTSPVLSLAHILRVPNVYLNASAAS